jgi:hypothetical protein
MIELKKPGFNARVLTAVCSIWQAILRGRRVDASDDRRGGGRAAAGRAGRRVRGAPQAGTSNIQFKSE